MKQLFIVFNKLDIATAFNEIKDSVDRFLIDFENEIGFSEDLDHFHRLLPNQPIIGNTFGTNTEGFKSIKTEQSEVLLIQLSENIALWNDDFKEDFKAYAAQFDKVFISYHLGANKGDDVKYGSHRLIEDFIEQKKENKLITTDKYHHEFSLEGEDQLYGFLAKLIVENRGEFDESIYTSLVEKLLSFFSLKDSNDKNELQLIYDCKTNIGTEYLSETSKEYCIKTIANYNSLIKTDSGIKEIHDILDKRIIKL